ncbi:MAG: hypothetical protein K0V04_25005 [Deltaproteobacteria bacterium]|nr:hypothetical protein [Deltaproteobacteria bacterium]
MVHLQPTFRRLSFAVTLAGATLVAPAALAGELKFSDSPIDVDEAGKITDGGRSATKNELGSLPGEDIWPVHLWAKIDKGAPGPLYVEFYGTLPGNGKRYKVSWHHEHNDYQGEKFLSLAIELDGNVGFNKGKTYTVELVQLNDKGKNIKLASSKLTLASTEAEAGDGDGDGDDGDDDGEPSEQDVLDSFAGGDQQDEGDAGPPPVTPPATKKGCRIDSGSGAAPGVLVLLLLGAGLAGRRRR